MTKTPAPLDRAPFEEVCCRKSTRTAQTLPIYSDIGGRLHREEVVGVNHSGISRHKRMPPLAQETSMYCRLYTTRGFTTSAFERCEGKIQHVTRVSMASEGGARDTSQYSHYDILKHVARLKQAKKNLCSHGFQHSRVRRPREWNREPRRVHCSPMSTSEAGNSECSSESFNTEFLKTGL